MKGVEILEMELNRIIRKYCRGRELILKWMPEVGRKVIYSEEFGKELRIAGEVKNNIVYIYESDVIEALDVLEHEFFEYFLDELLSMSDIVFNEVMDGYVKAINRIRYKNKESLINTLVEIEKEERKKCSRTKK